MKLSVPSFDATTHVPVLEHFYSIQGEGFHTGTAAYFIRTAGCDVGCYWCDVKESWQVHPEQLAAIADLVQQALKYPSRVVVITGGESLMYDMTFLTVYLKQAGFQLHLETSGAYPLSGMWDWICLSPKKFRKPIQTIFQKADELKVIIRNKADFSWAEENALRVRPNCRLYLQPEWSVAQKIQPLIVEYVKQHPQWHISLQTHKYLQIP